MTAQRSLFLEKFFYEPSKIGSITPSSKFLTRKMFFGLAWNEINSIIELGAGTGVFTEYIASHKKSDCKAVIIEQDTFMRRDLQTRFPDFSCAAQAENLPFILQSCHLKKADCIISGLPFAIFSKELRAKILCAVKNSLKKDGQFIAFQYSPQMYSSLRKNFTDVKLGFELRNFPPAFIYRCKNS